MRTLFQPLLRKLEGFAPMTCEERQAICGLPLELRHCVGQEDLLLQGQRPEGAVLVMSGFAMRYKWLGDGRRQIVGFCLPGDLFDIRVGVIRRLDYNVAALTPLVAGVIPTVDLQSMMDRNARVARALWWSSVVEESITREWIVNVGYRSAFERLAHMLCELYLRLESIGLARDLACELPIRQSEIADTLALSAVHVNRTLMELRRSGMVTLKHRRLQIHDMAGLQAAAGFDPAYLHLGGADSARDGSDLQ